MTQVIGLAKCVSALDQGDNSELFNIIIKTGYKQGTLVNWSLWFNRKNMELEI